MLYIALVHAVVACRYVCVWRRADPSAIAELLVELRERTDKETHSSQYFAPLLGGGRSSPDYWDLAELTQILNVTSSTYNIST